ncbi:MAG: WD40 repeat domain-containing protein, partial [Streptomyces sp.]|nr:WD40 repeat domain-containing protein [Streptomyces sp.]
ESVTYSADGTKLMLGSEGEGSEVVAQDAPGDGGSSKSPSGGGSSASGDGDGGGNGTVKVGALAVAAVVAVVLGFRRLLRPRR